jgi:gliding motility-associated lipoprotein GldH
MKLLLRTCILVPCALCLLSYFSGCTTIDLYEKYVTIPHHSWQSSFKPTLSFRIEDTSAAYQVFFIIRHSEKYNYNNIYINLQTRQPGQDSTTSARFDLTLATQDKGWLGSGMDDIYEHRIPLTPSNEEFYFRKPGEYQFTIEQIMREDPLRQVYNVGLRIEKK